MDPRKLRCFQILAQELNFVRAAARLNISQPGLSQQIKQLELQLRVQLFERTSRKVSLTTAGEVFLKEVNALLDQSNKAVDRVRRAARGEVNTLFIGATSLAMFVVVPELIAFFRQMSEGIGFRFVHLNTAEQERALKAGTIHAAILHPPLDTEALKLIELLDVPFDAVMSVDNPLANQKQVKLRQLSAFPFVLWNRQATPRTFDSVISHCERAGFSPNIVAETERITGLLGLVASDVGVSLLVQPYRQLARPRVLFKPVESPGPTLKIAVACRLDSTSPSVTALFKAAALFKQKFPQWTDYWHQPPQRPQRQRAKLQR